jgi:hypothetical protein
LDPGDEWVDVGWRGAIHSQLDNTMTWHFPGAPEYIEARWDPAIADQARSQLQMVLATWNWDQPIEAQ